MTECPNCASAADEHATFCEVCGLEFASGKLPEAPPPPQPIAAPAPVGPETEKEGAPAAAVPSGVDDSGWIATVEADRVFFDTTSAESPDVTIVFPEGMTAVEVPLRGVEILIGRKVEEDNVHPDLDLGADAGVSRRHAALTRRADGRWDLVDLGSTNGTRLGPDSDPIPANDPVVLDDGSTLHVGAWTRVTIRRRSAPE